jgi:hypothetical protein
MAVEDSLARESVHRQVLLSSTVYRYRLISEQNLLLECVLLTQRFVSTV